ncbi:ABC transporter ATP-binding protein [Flexithrix dorotheae]|uniref:ABC transporter ATP-binding protein n=1 Tax=Flexithrix dorotheae TaxID=70993 RepID=UPI000372E1BA|nr:ABC transporter ATP-binding protein [Flexithrix dorotheae]
MHKLQIQNLSKIYPNGVHALKNISLTINDGMFGLLGPNGAGKSSLMRIIATIQEPSSGTVTFNEKDIIRNPEYIRKQIGFLPQEFGVYPKISAEQLLDHLAILKGISQKNERKEQIWALLQQTNLFEYRKKAVHTFSGGMKQRFGIAQALLGNPQLIIVDEPTAGLDPEERNRFLNLLSEIGEKKVVILSTHIVEDIRELCAQMAILGMGEIINHGNPLEITKSLEGRIWTKTINRASLPEYQNKFKIISTRLVAGKTQIHVYSNSLPDGGFQAAAPDLESVYFTTLSKVHHPVHI